MPLPKDELIRHANEFANSEAVSDLLDKMEDDYVSAWKGTSPEDDKRREHLFRMVSIVATFRNELRSFAQSKAFDEFNARLRHRKV